MRRLPKLLRMLPCCMALAWLAAAQPAAAAAASIGETIDRVQPKMVKIFGSGGFRGLEAYQSGMLVSADGYILTVLSYVLEDTEHITVVLHDGRKLPAKLLGADPRLEVAVLKIDGKDLPHFDLDKSVQLEPGARVLALSNCFGVAQGDEPNTVQDGIVSVVANLSARRGAFETTYRGPVYVIDAVTNNPGSAGGALVTRRGELAAMLGKELRNSLNNTWLNYAMPIGELRKSIDEIRAGKFVARQPGEAEKKPARGLKLSALGITLVPDVLERTPPYVDAVKPDSPAAKAGIQPDDLIVLVGDHLIQSCKSLISELEYIDYEDWVRLTVIRGQELVELTAQASQDK